MKIDKEKVQERLQGVPESRRSHIYDASIVLEFLVKTFMPTKFFLPETFKPQPGIQLGTNSMKKVSVGKEMLMRDLYDLYLLFREQMDYTARIESRYIFGIIIRNLRYYKNGWEFTVWRVGVAQIWHVGPLVMRKDVPTETRNKYAAKLEDKTVERTTVEADPVADPEAEDERVPQNRDEEAAQILQNGTTVEYSRFVEVEYEIDEALDRMESRFTEAFTEDEQSDMMCLDYPNLCNGDSCNGRCQLHQRDPGQEEY